MHETLTHMLNTLPAACAQHDMAAWSRTVCSCISAFGAPAAPPCEAKPPVPSTECINQAKTPKITTSVGITIPNHVGLEVNYKICFGNETCENGLISVFGNPGDLDKNLAISSEHFNIREDMVRMKLHTK